MKKWKNKKEEPGPPSKSTSNARTPSPKKGLSKSAESISQPPNRPLPRWDAFNLRNLGQPLFQNGTPTASTAEDERGKKMQEHIQFEQGSKIHEDEQGVSIKLRYSVGEHRGYRYWLESIDDIETDYSGCEEVTRQAKVWRTTFRRNIRNYQKEKSKIENCLKKLKSIKFQILFENRIWSTSLAGWDTWILLSW